MLKWGTVKINAKTRPYEVSFCLKSISKSMSQKSCVGYQKWPHKVDFSSFIGHLLLFFLKKYPPHWFLKIHNIKIQGYYFDIWGGMLIPKLLPIPYFLYIVYHCTPKCSHHRLMKLIHMLPAN